LVQGEKASPTQVAQQFVNLGQTLFKEGNYGAALEHFIKAAERLEALPGGVPPVLFRNIARCHDQLGAVSAAIENYQRFVEQVPDTPQLAKAARHAREAITRLQRILDATALSFSIKPKNATLYVDGKLLVKIPTGNWRVEPGKHVVKVSAPGHEDRTVEVNVAVGSMVPLILRLDAIGGQPAPVAKVEKSGDRTLSYILGGLRLTKNRRDVWAKFESDSIYNSPENQNPGPDQNSRTEESESIGNLGWGLTALGGAAFVGAIVMWPSAQTETALVPTFDANGGGLVWRGRF